MPAAFPAPTRCVSGWANSMSATGQHPFDQLSLENGATLIFTPCPGTKDVSLEASLRQLAEAGATAIVSTTSDKEMERLGVSELPTLCERLNLAWFQLPIEDDAAPESAFTEAWARHKLDLLARLNERATLAIHCRGGSGRTGLSAALLMMAMGTEIDQAIAAVQSLRPKAIRLPAHQEFLQHNV